MTWVPSVRLWNLPSWSDPQKALQTLNRAASEGGVASAVKDRARELGSKTLDRVELPGFHLFDGASPIAPYTWLLPQPKGDVQDLLSLWESYVNQNLGSRSLGQSPLTPIERDTFVLTRTDFGRVFGGPRAPGEWAQPAAMMIAIAQHLEGQENLELELSSAPRYERRKVLKLRMHVSGYLMEVTPKGVYSNMKSSRIAPRFQASDAKLDGLCIRPLRTDHPLAVALVENEEAPHACLQAANVVLRALQLGMLAESDIKLSSGANLKAAREASVLEAIGLLDRERNLRLVYDKLVPGVVTAAEFRRDFGNPFRGTSTPRSETVDKWREQLFALAT
ncbi:hypothetical protein J7E62_24670 [Variovorax paradoxus]|nr:hypothetical protein [Variovorax paradoxus]